MEKKNHLIPAILKETAGASLLSSNTGYELLLTKRASVFLCLILWACIAAYSSCFNRTRFNNFNWQLDSIRYYTVKLDSMLKEQNEEIAHLRIDFYTKTSELSEKIEMLNSRIGDTESHLTAISQKLGAAKKTATDADDISQLSPEARLIYESAYLNYVKGNYLEAISGFQSYLKTLPDSPLSDNALYWIGESYAAMGKSQSAVNTFQEIINRYPESNKRPTALYKMAIIYEEAGDAKTARYYYAQIVQDFPHSPEATLAHDKLKD
jgi:tol-pal system protein YbgF